MVCVVGKFIFGGVAPSPKVREGLSQSDFPERFFRQEDDVVLALLNVEFLLQDVVKFEISDL